MLVIPKTHVSSLGETDGLTDQQLAAMPSGLRKGSGNGRPEGNRLPRGVQLRKGRMPVGGASALSCAWGTFHEGADGLKNVFLAQPEQKFFEKTIFAVDECA